MGGVILKGGGDGHNLLDEGNLQMPGNGETAGACDDRADFHGTKGFESLPQEGGKRFLYVGVMPLVSGK